MSRITTRILLAVSIFVAIIVIAIAMKHALNGKESAWAVIAASLAVITSVVSSWNAQRVIELEEDKQLPYPYPYIDVKSRYGVVLLRIKNFGNELLDIHKQPIKFDSAENGIDIPILLPKESITKTLGGQLDFFNQNKKHKYKGKIRFKNPSGIIMGHPFIVDADMYGNTVSYDQEELKTHVELQKIPEALNNLANLFKK
jgi:hypothetical protein